MLALFFITVFMAAIVAAMSLWTQRTLTYWFTLFKKQTVSVPFWIALLVTLVLSGGIFSVNLLTELIRLVIE